ncbi:MAG: hypothetical protein EBR30_28670 [Cytophagia bacterium]|nr:hypothetical protein [Cytophagia bacterium]
MVGFAPAPATAQAREAQRPFERAAPRSEARGVLRDRAPLGASNDPAQGVVPPQRWHPQDRVPAPRRVAQPRLRRARRDRNGDAQPMRRASRRLPPLPPRQGVVERELCDELPALPRAANLGERGRVLARLDDPAVPRLPIPDAAAVDHPEARRDRVRPELQRGDELGLALAPADDRARRRAVDPAADRGGLEGLVALRDRGQAEDARALEDGLPRPAGERPQQRPLADERPSRGEQTEVSVAPPGAARRAQPEV